MSEGRNGSEGWVGGGHHTLSQSRLNEAEYLACLLKFGARSKTVSYHSESSTANNQ